MIPALDPAGILAAVASAALFTAAIVYLIRSKAVNPETRLSALLRADGSPAKPELFSTVILDRPFSVRGLLLSIALHVFTLLGTPLLPYLFPEKLHFDFRRYNVKIMEFRIPAPLLYTGPERPGRGAALAQRQVRAALRKPLTTKRETARSTAPAMRRPTLELPRSSRARSKDVVIEPDQPPDVAISMPQPLPTAFLWAQAPAPLELSRVVGGPRTLTPPTFSFPQAQPKVQQPNREIAISELQIGAAPVLTFRPPQLPVPPGNVAPVRMAAPPIEAPGELPASALSPGSPMNLIALMNTPAPPAPGYLLEAGNRLAEPQPASSGGPGAGASPSQDAGLKNATAPASAAESGAVRGAEEGSAKASGASSGTANPGASSPAKVKGTLSDLLRGAGTGTGAAAGASEKAADSRPKPSPYPTGNMGVIIVQESALEAVLEGGETLTGQPVYTVYFDVPGAPRRWILQYCVPGSASQSFVRGGDSVIRILPKRSVQPPFPLERIPLDLNGFQGELRRLVVYAQVNERGETENVQLIRGTGQEIDRTAVATLRRWVFRPAMRGDDAVAVEALFGIPLQ